MSSPPSSCSMSRAGNDDYYFRGVSCYSITNNYIFLALTTRSSAEAVSKHTIGETTLTVTLICALAELARNTFTLFPACALLDAPRDTVHLTTIAASSRASDLSLHSIGWPTLISSDVHSTASASGMQSFFGFCSSESRPSNNLRSVPDSYLTRLILDSPKTSVATINITIVNTKTTFFFVETAFMRI